MSALEPAAVGKAYVPRAPRKASPPPPLSSLIPKPVVVEKNVESVQVVPAVVVAPGIARGRQMRTFGPKIVPASTVVNVVAPDIAIVAEPIVPALREPSPEYVKVNRFAGRARSRSASRGKSSKAAAAAVATAATATIEPAPAKKVAAKRAPRVKKVK